MGRRSASVWIIWGLSLLLSIGAFAGRVDQVVIDPIGTILVKEQDYRFEGGKKIPLLQEVTFTVNRGTRSQTKTLYLRTGAEDYIRYLLKEKANGDLKAIHFLSSKDSQAFLNAALSAIQIDGKSLLDIADGVMGSEAATAYWTLTQPSGKMLRADLGIFSTGANAAFWPELKKGEIKNVGSLKAGRATGLANSYYLTTRPNNLVNTQSEYAVKVADLFKKDSAFWVSYQAYFESPMRTPGSDHAVQTFLAKLDTERSQLKTLISLTEMAKTYQWPNPFNEWNALLTSGSALGLERAHFNYLIPDLLMKDSPDTIFLVTGRDAKSYYESLKVIGPELGMKGELLYTPLSRLASSAEKKRILEVLEKDGLDVQAVKEGRKKLYLIDSNHHGSIQRQITEAFISKDDPEWRTKVRNIRTFLFNPAWTAVNPPEDFTSFEQYMVNGAFIDYPIHQERTDYSFMRRLTTYLDGIRPKDIKRTTNADQDGNLIEEPSHPTERRYAAILDEKLADYYKSADAIAWLKKRMAFLKGQCTDCPRIWELHEPIVPATTKIFKVEDQEAVFAENKSYHRQVIAQADIAFDQTDPTDRPEYIKHHRKPKQEIEIEHFQYAPAFAKKDPVDLSQGYLNLPVLSESATMKIWPRLDLSTFESQREAGLANLSRNVNGKVVPNGSKKTLLLEGEELAKATIEANHKVGQALLKMKDTKFANSEQLSNFIVEEIAKSYIAPVKVIGKPYDIWRSWNFQNEAQKASGDFFANHPVEDLEKDWIWFNEWLSKSLRLDYDPIDLAARVHYYLSNFVHPFVDGVGKTTRDVMDFVFIRKGYMPIDWTKVSFEDYWAASSSLDATRQMIIDSLNMKGACDRHVLRVSEALPTKKLP